MRAFRPTMLGFIYLIFIMTSTPSFAAQSDSLPPYKLEAQLLKQLACDNGATKFDVYVKNEEYAVFEITTQRKTRFLLYVDYRIFKANGDDMKEFIKRYVRAFVKTISSPDFARLNYNEWGNQLFAESEDAFLGATNQLAASDCVSGPMTLPNYSNWKLTDTYVCDNGLSSGRIYDLEKETATIGEFTSRNAKYTLIKYENFFEGSRFYIKYSNHQKAEAISKKSWLTLLYSMDEKLYNYIFAPLNYSDCRPIASV